MPFFETLFLLLLIGPVSFFISTVFILAALGKSLGFRKKYVEFLLFIFEYGKKRIENAQKIKNTDSDDEELEVLSTTSEDTNCNRRDDKKIAVEPTSVLEETKRRLSFTDVSRTSLPRARNPSSLTEQCNGNPVGVINQDRPDFAFSDIFEFVQGGVEAIVEDQVTQRFVAEELKSWNLLTRTNRDYEFISWRLSLIWLVGFFLRYCIMLPFRVMICFVGTGTLMSLTFLIGLLPDSFKIKKQLNDLASKFSFRLLSRAFSAIVTYHQIENKPTKNGICVANHTSPIDVVLLACDSSYAMVVYLTISTALLGLLPLRLTLRRKLYDLICLNAFGLLSWSISAVVTYHDTENRPGGWDIGPNGTLSKGTHSGGGICVANHTSPIDVVVLAVDNTYAMIGQVHGGFLGILQRALGRASSHIWFERSEMKDREAVARRLKEHVEDKSKLPILIFPEGTCINNSAVMQFKKGSFEVGGVIYPVAIKYDSRFGDPFWNSHEYSMLQYLYMMMTSWAIVCDVWYLPPMTRLPEESSVDFANRVKGEIARKGGLVDLDWDGQLKRAPAKREWKEKEQLKYAQKFAARSNSINTIIPNEEEHLMSSA